MGVRISLIRGTDLLVAEFELVNMRISADGTHLEKESPGDPAQVIVRLPAQHVWEEALPAGGIVVGHVNSFSAGRTVLSFGVQADRIPLTVAGLLDPALVSPLGVPRSIPPDPGEISVFLGTQRTAIEFPTRLLLSPEGLATWRHRDAPLAVPDGRTEIWHTRLVSDTGGPVQLRAYAHLAGRPDREGMPIINSQLADIVTLTSVQDLVSAFVSYQARPLDADLMMLTALGASVRMRGLWEYPDLPPEELTAIGFPTPTVTQYEHVTSLGRDVYVKVVSRGFLHTGHRASVIGITERTFEVHPDIGPPPIALLRKKDILVVQEPEQTYGEHQGYHFGGREMPLRSLRYVDTVTPPLSDFEADQVDWIQVNGVDHKLNAVVTDAEGRRINVSVPVMFIPANRTAAEATSTFNNAEAHRRVWAVAGQPLAMAAPDAPGATAAPTESIELGMVPVGGHPLGALPMVAKASVRLPALEQLTGVRTPHLVRFHQAYLDGGLEGTAAGAFLELFDHVPVGFAAERVGGLAKPDNAIKDITSRGGILPSVFTRQSVSAQDLAGVFGLNAKLLGNIGLADVLGDVGELGADAFPTTPGDLQAILDDVARRLPAPIMLARALADGGGTEVRYVWRPPLKDGFGPLRFAPGSALTLDARTVRAADGAVTATVTGELRNFRFEFLDIVVVTVDKLTFTSAPGRKPAVDITGLDIDFRGELRFVNTLRELFPADRFGAGTVVDVTPRGIEAGYSLAVPRAGVGVFSLHNIALSARLTVPFDDRPAAFRFMISERHDPFNVSVALFGGGGFFALTVGADGVKQVEAAIEFGGAVSLNLGVASGGVYVMGGIYFAWAENAVSLTGFLRAGGYLSVLGIVTVAVEFRMALGYRKVDGRSEMYGQASLTVSVKVAFFSKSVSLSVERSFAGAAGDPTFEDSVEPADWDEYCLAYA